MINSRAGKIKDIKRRGIPLNSSVTTDNYQVLVTQDAITDIANRISALTKRRMSPSDINDLVQLIEESFPPAQLYGLKFTAAHDLLARSYVNRFNIASSLQDRSRNLSVPALVHLDEESANMLEYQKKELNQFTDNENQIKYSVYADRRGNAIIDRDRVLGYRSSPDNLPSGFRLDNEALANATYQTLKNVDSFLAPDSVDTMFRRFNQVWTTYSSVNLPRQSIQLDSRNRDVTDQIPNEYRWFIHSAGQIGYPGDVRSQDTIKEVMQMRIDNMWIPASQVPKGYYGKMRLLIKEFLSQSIYVTEFQDPNQNKPIQTYYHWQFDIVQTVGDRIRIVPENPTYTFRRPFARVETITFLFYLPYEQMVLLPDRCVYTITYANPTLFTLTSGINHNLNTGDLVYVLNSTSGSAAIDAELTRTVGWIITKISVVQFTIPVDSSALPGVQSGVNVYYGSKRIFCDLEFLSLEC